MSDDDFDDMFGGDASGSDDNEEAQPHNSLGQITSSSTLIPPETVPNTSELQYQHQMEGNNNNNNNAPLPSPPAENDKDDQSHASTNSNDFDEMFGESSEDDDPVQIIHFQSSNIRVPRKSKQGGAPTLQASKSLKSVDTPDNFLTNNRGESPISSSSRKRQRPPTPPCAITRIRKKKPEDYKSFTMDDFWKALRSWDFVWEVNEQMKRNPKQQQQQSSSAGTNANEQDFDLSTIVSPPVCVQPLPDDFDCVEQYVALWAPLQLEETKAQILSDVLSNRTVSFQKLTQPIQATPKRASETYSEYLTLDIVSRSDVAGAGPNDGVSSQNSSNAISRKRSNAGGGVEFLQNDLVLITCDSSIVEQAYKGTLRPPDTKSSYSMSSLLSMASPFVEGRLAIVGVVSARCKGLDGLVVNVSKRLWKDTKSLGARDLFLLKLGTNVTGEFFIEMDFIHVVLKAIK